MTSEELKNVATTKVDGFSKSIRDMLRKPLTTFPVEDQSMQDRLTGKVGEISDAFGGFIRKHPEVIAASIYPLLGGLIGTMTAPDPYGLRKNSAMKGAITGGLAGAGTVAYANRDQLKQYIKQLVS